VPQTVGVVAVRLPQGNLIEPLAQLFAAVMFDFARLTLIREYGSQSRTQSQPIIDLAQ